MHSRLLLFLSILTQLLLFPTFQQQISIYKNEDNWITIPSKLFDDQEPFYFNLLSINETDGLNQSINSACYPVRLDLKVQEVGSLINFDSYYRNPEFVIVGDFLYLIDISHILRVYLIIEATDSVMEQVSTQDIGENITKSTFLRVFSNQELNQLYVIIDNALIIFSLENNKIPLKIKKLTFEANTTFLPIEAVYEENCFIVLMNDRATINGYVLSNDTFEITKNFTIGNEFFGVVLLYSAMEINDLAIDGNMLFLSDANKGILILNITQKYINKISLIYFDNQQNIDKISIFGDSFVLIRSFHYESEIYDYYDHFIEEYYIDTSKGNYQFILNRNLTLTSNLPIISVHISEKFVFILQRNLLKIFEHSIPSTILDNNSDFLKDIVAKDLLVLERGPMSNMIIGIFGSKITLYNFMEMNPRFICNPNDTFSDGIFYSLNFFTLTKTCQNENDRIEIQGNFSYCNYSNYIDLYVELASAEPTYVRSLAAGIIAAIVILSFCGLILIGLFIYYYMGLKKKYKELEHNYTNLTKTASHEELARKKSINSLGEVASDGKIEMQTDHQKEDIEH